MEVTRRSGANPAIRRAILKDEPDGEGMLPEQDLHPSGESTRSGALDSYRQELARLIESEVRNVLDEEIKKARQELLAAQKAAIMEIVEEHKLVIREVVEDQKKTILEKAEELRQALARFGL